MAYNSINRKKKADNTRQSIFHSAEKLFAVRDFNDVSVDEIVQLAGVSKGSFYVHFISKDALASELIAARVAAVDMDYKEFLDALPNDIPAKDMLLLLIGKITDVLIDEIGRDKMRMIYKAQIINDFNADSVSSYNRDLNTLFNYVILRGIKRKEFKSDLSSEVLTRHFLIAIRGVTFEWCIRPPGFEYKEQALDHFGLLLAALK